MVQDDLGDAECLAHLPDGGPRAVAHDICHHRRAVPPVFFIHVLDDLFPPIVLDVEVDIRRLGPLARQEALEEQVHAHGIDRGHPEAVADHGVGRGPAPLADDALHRAEPDQLPHREEVPAVAQLLDEGKLLFEEGLRVLGDVAAVAAPRAFPGDLPKPGCRGETIRDNLVGIPVDQLLEGEEAPVGHLPRGLDQLGR